MSSKTLNCWAELQMVLILLIRARVFSMETLRRSLCKWNKPSSFSVSATNSLDAWRRRLTEERSSVPHTENTSELINEATAHYWHHTLNRLNVKMKGGFAEIHNWIIKDTRLRYVCQWTALIIRSVVWLSSKLIRTPFTHFPLFVWNAKLQRLNYINTSCLYLCTKHRADTRREGGRR